MSGGSTRRPPPMPGAAAVVAALAVGLVVVSAMQLWIARRAAGEQVTGASALLYGAAAWLPWAITAPLIHWTGRRFDFQPGRRIASLAMHLGVFALCYAPAAFGFIYLAFTLFAAGERPIPRSELIGQVFASSRLQLGLIVYCGIIGIDRALRTWQALRERELQATRLEAQAARARLEALAARLQPHFLFNTLHAIGALIDEDPVRARAMLALLGDLLRDVISDADEGEIPLGTELELLRRYLAIEQMRFADRLTVEIEAAPETLQRAVPRLLLQPVAENALRHGLAPRAAPGRLRIETRIEGHDLVIVVANDGVGLPATVREGVGLATTRERLGTRLPAGSFSLGQLDGQVVARLTLPARPGDEG